MDNKKAGTSMLDEAEAILRDHSVTAEELAERLYGEDRPDTRRGVIELVSRLKVRRGVAVESTVYYTIRR